MEGLVIVESPTKAKTIGRFLGSNFKVESSYGHVRDLPKGRLGVDTEGNFEPQYVVPRDNQKRVSILRKLAANVGRVILATDEDREGEAIAWHLAAALKLRNPERIVFHEITKNAIGEALKRPREIDLNLVDAQQARRVLDRLVGYKLSPFLWQKVARGLSAGRVQSVALRLIAEREEEISNFKPEEYWTILAALKNDRGGFTALLTKLDGEPIPKLGIKSGTEAEHIVNDLKKAEFRVAAAEQKEVRRNPLPPFTTSTLQQTAARRLGFSSKKTMYIAQQLYENGYVTYIRTDSVNISADALAAAERWIRENLPAAYVPQSPRTFKNKSRLAQEAHEAVRPTDPHISPDSLRAEKPEQRLYDLILRRFIASQLPQAVFDATRIEVGAKGAKRGYTLAATGTVMRFDGFLQIWPMKFEEKELPEIKEGESLTLIEVKPERHETEPPPRYSEASLVKTLEQYGIGRPSTYAPTISVIQERNYVEKQQGRFHPTEMGILVNKVLTEHFPKIVDIQFTAKMEEDLDDIAQGKERWRDVIRNFYDPFAKHLEEKYESVSKEKPVNETTNEICEKCGRPMVIKLGRFGRFLACSGYPECKNTKTIRENGPEEIKTASGVPMPCPKCGEGHVIRRRSKRGRFFYGCSRYPTCDFASWTKPDEEAKKRYIDRSP